MDIIVGKSQVKTSDTKLGIVTTVPDEVVVCVAADPLGGCSVLCNRYECTILFIKY